MDLQKLLSEVFAPGRLDILKALQQRPLRYTDLTREVALSEGEVSRHLNRLHQAGLIEKQVDGTFQPTPLSLVALSFEASLGLLASRSEFFRTHDVHALDQRFLLRIEALSHAEFLADPIETFGAIAEVRGSVRKRLDGICLIAEHVASGTISHEVFAPIARRIKEHGTQVRLITQHEDLTTSIEYQGVLRPQFRVVPVSRFDLFISDTHALFSVANREGKMDYASAFFGTHPRFYEWCRDVFEHRWAAATPVTPQYVEKVQRGLIGASNGAERGPNDEWSTEPNGRGIDRGSRSASVRHSN